MNVRRHLVNIRRYLFYLDKSRNMHDIVSLEILTYSFGARANVRRVTISKQATVTNFSDAAQKYGD